MTEPLPDGVHDFAGYRADPNRLSPNGAKKLLPPSTPKKFDEARKKTEPPRKVWDFGLVAHKVILGEGCQFLALDPEVHGLTKSGDIAKSPTSTDNWKAAVSNARAEGLTPIHIDDYHKAVEMAQVVHAHETAGPLLKDGEAEQWIYWTDAESGQKLRQRLDWKTETDNSVTIIEYKTCVCADQEVFARHAFKLGYFLAFAFAVTGARTLWPNKEIDYVIIAQEKEPPYDLAVYRPDDIALQVAQDQMRQAITTYQRCTETNRWPGYPVGINTISVPLWAIDDEMEIAV